MLIENGNRSRNYRNFEPKSKFFRKCLSKSIFLPLLTIIEIFKILNRNWKCWSKSIFFRKCKIFEIFKRNRNFVENIDRNRDFRNFEPKWNFFRKCWLKSRFPKFWTQTEFFSKMLTEIWTEIDFFRKCWAKSRVFKFWAEIDFFFENVDRSRDFLRFWTKIYFFFKYVDTNRDFRNFEPKSKFFR